MFLILFKGLLSLFSLSGGMYFIFIGPVLFRFWIIPKIASRFNVIIKLDYYPAIRMRGISWIGPQWEISWYICCSYFNWELPIKRYHMGKLPFFRDIQYDIDKATRAEIIMSFVTASIFIMMIVCSITVITLDKCF